MGRFRVLVAVVLVLALAGSSYAKGKGKGGGKHALRGTVEKVETDSMVVKIQKGKKTDGTTYEQTFQLNSETKVEFVTVKKHAKGEKPEKETKPAALSDLKPGDHVRVSAGDGSTAKTVSIVQHGKRGKKSST